MTPIGQVTAENDDNVIHFHIDPPRGQMGVDTRNLMDAMDDWLVKHKGYRLTLTIEKA